MYRNRPLETLIVFQRGVVDDGDGDDGDGDDVGCAGGDGGARHIDDPRSAFSAEGADHPPTTAVVAVLVGVVVVVATTPPPSRRRQPMCLSIHGWAIASLAVMRLRGSFWSRRLMKSRHSRLVRPQSSAGKEYLPPRTASSTRSLSAPLKGGYPDRSVYATIPTDHRLHDL